MLIPVRCFTCGKVIGNKYETYIAIQTSKKDDERFDDKMALTQLGLHRYCCRRMLLTHVNMIEKLILYNSRPVYE